MNEYATLVMGGHLFLNINWSVVECFPVKVFRNVNELFCHYELKDDITNSDLEKAELLADYFSSVFTREPQENTPEDPIRCYNTVETCTINPSIVASKLKKLKTFKSPGPDGVHPKVINELADCISIPLSTIFNTSLTTGKLPIEWKQANIYPIHKKGSKTLPQNYRPVSITSVVGMIMDEIIRDTITAHVKENGY